MEFTCNKDNLIEAINMVQRAVPTRTTIPVLEGILIEVGEELKLTGNDMELGIECEVPAVIEEMGSVVVDSKSFGEIIRKLPDMYVTVKSVSENVINISCGAYSGNYNTISPEGYPNVMAITSDKEYKIDKQELKKLIKQTIFAVSQDDMRPILKGEFMEITGKSINFVAIDGYKMALKSIEREGDEPASVVIPARILNETARSIADDGLIQDITVCLNDNQIMFKADNFMIVSRLLKGEYLNYRSMIPREFKTEIKVKCADFMKTIERATLVMTDEKKFPLMVNISGGEIVITANAEHGSSRETVNAEVSGEDITLGFNSRNILDSLKAIEDSEIKSSFTTEKGPCVIKSADDEDKFTYMVMPVMTRG